MALIKCPECGKEISDKAAACPNCGYPINAQPSVPQNVPQNVPQAPAPGPKIFKPKLYQPIYGLKVDYQNRTFQHGMFGEIFSFDDILDVGIFENGGSFSKSSTVSTVGRAAIGSLFNPVGAIIGGVTGKKKNVEIVNSIEVQISVLSQRNPLLRIEIPIPKKTKKDSKDYTKAMAKAKQVEAAIKGLKMQ